MEASDVDRIAGSGNRDRRWCRGRGHVARRRFVRPGGPGRQTVGARVHECRHSHLHACMHARIHACIHACMHACNPARMQACAHARMHACMHACMHARFHE